MKPEHSNDISHFSPEGFIQDDDSLEEIRQKRLSAKGSLKGEVVMADDFDARLDEMREYM